MSGPKKKPAQVTVKEISKKAEAIAAKLEARTAQVKKEDPKAKILRALKKLHPME